ncbi:lycopene cyclase domain-containing protein [Clavibacter sp. MX14-G9D]|uniref:lycopene cyclase domain-containing protein n=1 Tax=Clavibacter sp. MX14-G9D TaxID=3064656 RepID=UPI00293E42C7|nr:lycopene cyclase domain-containing protein [Clavibacter sp. MX14-G9D]
MSYLVLDLLFLLPVAVVGFLFRRLLLREAAAVPYGSSRFDYPEYYWYRRMPVVILLAMTLVFDNIMIEVGLVGYDPDKLVGLILLNAPIEDFAYAIAALVLLPAVWYLLRRRRRVSGIEAHG